MSNTQRTKSAKDKIKAAKLPEGIATVCLRADLSVRHQELEEQLDAAKASGAGMLNAGTAERRALAKEIADLEAEMLEHTMAFTLRALGRLPWRDLLAEHPARKDEDRDSMGFNSDTFWPALLRASTVSPELDEEDWDALLAVLTDAQFSVLCDKAWGLNRRDITVPFSRLASGVLALSASESKPPNDSV